MNDETDTLLLNPDDSFDIFDSSYFDTSFEEEQKEDLFHSLDVSRIDAIPNLNTSSRQRNRLPNFSRTEDISEHAIPHEARDDGEIGKVARTFGLDLNNPPNISNVEYYTRYIQGVFNVTITRVAKKLLERAHRNEEIIAFKKLLFDGFQNWFLSNYRSRNDCYENYEDDNKKRR